MELFVQVISTYCVIISTIKLRFRVIKFCVKVIYSGPWYNKDFEYVLYEHRLIYVRSIYDRVTLNVIKYSLDLLENYTIHK